MKTTSATIRFAAAALLATGLAAAGLTGFAAPAAEAGHDHGHAAQAKPLPPGKRWASDATLRESMTRLRGAFEQKLPAIHRDRLAPVQYQALADTTGKEVANIVANCKLDPQADAALHGILAEIGEGTDAMAGKSATRPRDGAVKVMAALDRYGRTFDHPGWKRLPG